MTTPTSTQSPIRAGTNIGGYRLLHPLGKGGAGSVWEVSDDAGVHYAMKILHDFTPDYFQTSEEAREALQQEVSTLQHLRHPHVVSITDMELDGPIAFLVTELIDGPTLSENIYKTGVYQGKKLVDLAQDLLQALNAVHQEGIIHGDIKPSNIMISSSGIVLVDFGIASLLHSLDKKTNNALHKSAQENSRNHSHSHSGPPAPPSTHIPETIMGTPGFVAPELFEGLPPSCTTDEWAAAAVLAYAISGYSIFGVNDRTQTILTREFSGEMDTSHIPPQLVNSFKKALAPALFDRIPLKKLVHHIKEYVYSTDEGILMEDNPSFDGTIPKTVFLSGKDPSHFSHENSIGTSDPNAKTRCLTPPTPPSDNDISAISAASAENHTPDEINHDVTNRAVPKTKILQTDPTAHQNNNFPENPQGNYTNDGERIPTRHISQHPAIQEADSPTAVLQSPLQSSLAHPMAVPPASLMSVNPTNVVNPAGFAQYASPYGTPFNPLANPIVSPHQFGAGQSPLTGSLENDDADSSAPKLTFPSHALVLTLFISLCIGLLTASVPFSGLGALAFISWIGGFYGRLTLLKERQVQKHQGKRTVGDKFATGAAIPLYLVTSLLSLIIPCAIWIICVSIAVTVGHFLNLDFITAVPAQWKLFSSISLSDIISPSITIPLLGGSVFSYSGLALGIAGTLSWWGAVYIHGFYHPLFKGMSQAQYRLKTLFMKNKNISAHDGTNDDFSSYNPNGSNSHQEILPVSQSSYQHFSAGSVSTRALYNQLYSSQSQLLHNRDGISDPSDVIDNPHPKKIFPIALIILLGCFFTACVVQLFTISTIVW